MAVKPAIDRLLDSVILIDHLNGISQATEYLSGLIPGRTAVSVITRAEILVGLDGSSVDEAKRLLDEFILSLSMDQLLIRPLSYADIMDGNCRMPFRLHWLFRTTQN